MHSSVTSTSQRQIPTERARLIELQAELRVYEVGVEAIGALGLDFGVIEIRSGEEAGVAEEHARPRGQFVNHRQIEFLTYFRPGRPRRIDYVATKNTNYESVVIAGVGLFGWACLIAVFARHGGIDMASRLVPDGL